MPDGHAGRPELADGGEAAAPIIMFELGQWATPVPQPRRAGAISASFG